MPSEAAAAGFLVERRANPHQSGTSWSLSGGEKIYMSYHVKHAGKIYDTIH
jgi:hypothetical protein